MLVAVNRTTDELRLPFYDVVEIGRDDGRPDATGVILISNTTVSRRHCVIATRTDGRCYVRDVSRNDTRLDDRRLVPSIETELRPDQTLSVSPDVELVLEGEEHQSEPTIEVPERATVAMPAVTFAMLLVGDICNYTVLVRRAPSAVLQQSVNRVFERLSAATSALGGTVKEYQGDALVAFWEGGGDGGQVAAACHAAIELHSVAQQLAADRGVWQVDDFPLQMDWALATGPVMIDSIGGSEPTGLSMIGEPIVLAFRLEKFACDKLGRILACRVTRQMSSRRFRFRDLGDMAAKGFDKPDRVFALEEELRDSSDATPRPGAA